MDARQAKEELKEHLREYLGSIKGVDTSKKAFKCINPAHKDTHASMGIVGNNCNCFSCGAVYDILDIIALDNNLDSKQDFWQVLEIGCNMYNIDLDKGGYKMDAGQKQGKNGQGKGWSKKSPSPQLEAPTQAPPKDYTDYFKACSANLGTSDYLKSRGISEETARKFWLGYDSNCRAFGGGSALIIPTGKYSYTARSTDTRAEKGNRYRKTGASTLFNLKALDSPRPVFIVEGELDALSLEEIGYKALALGSTSNIDKLLKHFQSTRPSNLLLLALDKDEQGQKAQAELQAGLQKLSIKHYTVDIAGAFKDANEHLQMNRDSLKEACQQAEQAEQAELEAEKEAYKKTFAGNKILDFICELENSGGYNPISTGFTSLDALLEGGLYAGLYVIGAISSLGKTTFCLQIADQIAENTHKALLDYEKSIAEQELFNPPPLPPRPTETDVIIFSLEMPEGEIMAKSISRGTYKQSVATLGVNNSKYAKTTRGILTGQKWDSYSLEQLDTIHSVAGYYQQYAQHIKIVEGMGDVGTQNVREITERHIKLTGNKPVIIIDYLQILAPSVDKGTDKQNTDKAVLELKKISRDFGIPVIAISSFNRENYTEPVNMASYKESGAVEYSSDVLIGVQYAGMDYQEGESQKDKNRHTRIKGLIEDNINRGRAGRAQELQIKVLKNRNGQRGASYIDFYPMFNYFEEKPIFTGGAKLSSAVSSSGVNWDAIGETIKD